MIICSLPKKAHNVIIHLDFLKGKYTMNWELSVLHWFESIHNPVLNPVMKVITMLGDAGIFWIALSVIFLFFNKTRKAGIAMAISLVLSVIFTNLIIKNIADRIRPFVIDPTLLKDMLVKLPKDSSFPSGHTSASFAAATAFFVTNKKWGIPCLVLASLIAISRLYLTVHFPTDVIAGVILGVIYGIAAYFIMSRLIFKKEKSHSEN